MIKSHVGDKAIPALPTVTYRIVNLHSSKKEN